MCARNVLKDPDYLEGRRFLDAVCESQMLSQTLTSETDPRVILRRWEAPDSGLTDAQLRRGLSQCINDVLTWAKDWPAAEVTRTDQHLARVGLRGIFDRWIQQGSWILKILRRGRLDSETEWYLVREAVVAGSSELFSAEECDRLKELAARYEASRGGHGR